MDNILFYGDRGEATRRQVRSAAASHSHRIGPRKAKASKKSKVDEPAQPARKKKLEACAVTSTQFVIDKTPRPANISPLKDRDAAKESMKWSEFPPRRQEESPGSAASSLDNDFNARPAPFMRDRPRIELQSHIRGQLPSIRSDYSSPSPSIRSPLLDHLPRSDPYQHCRHDSAAADPLMITRIPPPMDPPRYERSFDGRLHLVTAATNPQCQSHCIPPALRVLPEPRSLARLTGQCSDKGMQKSPRSSSGNVHDAYRLPIAPAG